MAANARHRRLPWRVAILVGVGFALLGTAWAVANPVSASPDEPNNVVKSWATGTGRISGVEGPVAIGDTDPLQVAWFLKASRSYPLPARLQPATDFPCYANDRHKSAGCEETRPATGPTELVSTQFATYQPFLYLPAGIAMWGADSYDDLVWRGRLAYVALSAVLLGWAALLIASDDRPPVAVGGLLLAVTPMVVFLSASVTTNGVEAAAAICVWASLLRLTRPGEPSFDRVAWLGLIVSGTVMILTRMLDPFFMVVMVAVVLLAGTYRFRRSARTESDAAGDPAADADDAARTRRWRTATIVVLGVAALLSIGWTQLKTAHPPVDVGLALRSIKPAITDLPNQVRQTIGIFGWTNVTMPQPFYGVWVLLTGGLVVLALMFGTTRERLALAGLGVATLAATIGIGAGIEAQIGFPMQARYILPLAVGIPMLAAEILVRHPERLHAQLGRRVAWITIGGAAGLQLVAFVVNAHRYAVGQFGGWTPWWASQWSPPGGLAPWLLIAVAGTGCLLATLWAAPRPGSSPSPAADETETAVA